MCLGLFERLRLQCAGLRCVLRLRSCLSGLLLGGWPRRMLLLDTLLASPCTGGGGGGLLLPLLLWLTVLEAAGAATADESVTLLPWCMGLSADLCSVCCIGRRPCWPLCCLGAHAGAAAVWSSHLAKSALLSLRTLTGGSPVDVPPAAAPAPAAPPGFAGLSPSPNLE